MRDANLGDRAAIPQEDRHGIAVASEEPGICVYIDSFVHNAEVTENAIQNDSHLVTEMAMGAGHQLEPSSYSHSIVAGGLLVMS